MSEGGGLDRPSAGAYSFTELNRSTDAALAGDAMSSDRNGSASSGNLLSAWILRTVASREHIAASRDSTSKKWAYDTRPPPLPPPPPPPHRVRFRMRAQAALLKPSPSLTLALGLASLLRVHCAQREEACVAGRLDLEPARAIPARGTRTPH